MVEIVDRSKTLPKHPNKRYATRTTHKIDTIIIHHSATTPGRDDPLAFAHYHIEALGWAGIGYHYVVEPSGIIYKCQPLTVVSNHASGANTRSIGICLAGNFDNQVPTDPQWDAAIELVQELCSKMPKITRILGHREVPNTHKSCPGNRFDIELFRKTLKG